MFKVYDFECTKCKKIFELFLDNKEIERVTCPECKGALKRLLAAPPFHLKGTGWAKDNYGLKETKEKT